MVVRSPPPVLSANKRRKVNREFQLGDSIRGTSSRGECQPSHHHGESLVLSPRRTDDAPNRRKVLVQGFLGDVDLILAMGRHFLFLPPSPLPLVSFQNIQTPIQKNPPPGIVGGERGAQGVPRGRPE